MPPRAQLAVGLSTCPNDTFAFAGLLAGAVDTEGLDLAFTLADVEELNGLALAGQLDVAKVSFHAALLAGRDLVVLPVGSALGRGVGPLVLAPGGREHDGEPEPSARVLAPGRHTTATLLWQLFHDTGRLEHVVFSEVMPALERGEADLGLCIHEGRFTWRERGLGFVEDLGATWEARTGEPLPLGGLVARAELGTGGADAPAARFTRALRRSLAWARADQNRTAVLETMRTHAQELSDTVLWQHVELYVNELTADLGPSGRAALAALSREARAAGVAKGDLRILEVEP